MRREIINKCRTLASGYKIPLANALAFLTVETPCIGFDEATGKIIIQFEPAWFRKLTHYSPSGLWSVNGVERQQKEWLAFNDAFSKNPEKAMESTSIGIGQILGLHYKRLGFPSVNAMWDNAKTGEDAQLEQFFKFIASDAKLLSAVRMGNTHLMAYYYNGSGYKVLAKKLGRTPYNISLSQAIRSFKDIK